MLRAYSCTILFGGVCQPVAGHLAAAIERAGMRAGFATAAATLQWIARSSPAAVITAVSDDGPGGGLELLRAIRQKHPDLCIIAVSAGKSDHLMLAAFRAGATDYLPQPACGEELAQQVLRHIRHEEPAGNTTSMVGSSEAMLQIRNDVAGLSRTSSNVLITGETGTGKELVAGLIHRNSARANKPLICIDCAAIPDALLESELFGYERGAFTGAHVTTPGKMETANGGTVFLDEIGELSPYAQVRLLRVLEERTIHRLGGHKPISLDIRVVAATNRDLDQLAKRDGFRKDLYFRLNVGRVHLPPLRERKQDIPELVEHYVGQMNGRFDSAVRAIQPDVMEHLLSYEWPGNIRELRNVIEAVFIGRPTSSVTFVDLPEWFRKLHPREKRPASDQERLLSALYATNWNKSKAAGHLNWSRMTLYRKMAKYGLQRSTDNEL